MILRGDRDLHWRRKKGDARLGKRQRPASAAESPGAPRPGPSRVSTSFSLSLPASQPLVFPITLGAPISPLPGPSLNVGESRAAAGDRHRKRGRFSCPTPAERLPPAQGNGSRPCPSRTQPSPGPAIKHSAPSRDLQFAYLAFHSSPTRYLTRQAKAEMCFVWHLPAAPSSQMLQIVNCARRMGDAKSEDWKTTDRKR